MNFSDIIRGFQIIDILLFSHTRVLNNYLALYKKKKKNSDFACLLTVSFAIINLSGFSELSVFSNTVRQKMVSDSYSA